MKGVDLVVVGEGSEAVGALGVEGSEGEDAGEGKRLGKALSLACLFSEALCIENTLLHLNLAVSNTLKCHEQCTYVCNQISPFSMGALGIY